jgi:hypothetical protein
MLPHLVLRRLLLLPSQLPLLLPRDLPLIVQVKARKRLGHENWVSFALWGL